MRTYKSATLNRLKSDLKTLAATIKVEKPAYRKAYSEYARELGDWKAVDQHGVACVGAQYEFRHKHIVYCLLRGRTMGQIENTPRCANENGYCHACNHPNQKYIDKLLEESKAAMMKEQPPESEQAHAVG